MVYTAPTTRSNTELITETIWNTDLVDNINYLAGLTVGGVALSTLGADAAVEDTMLEGCRVYNNANISISDSTITALTFNTERYDDNTIHDTSTNPARLTCKTAGKYLIAGNVEFAANQVGYRRLYIRHYPIGGGGPIDIAVVSDVAVDAAVGPLRFAVATVYALAVGDYVTLAVYQSSSGALNVSVQANYSPEFMMQRISN